MQKSAIGRLCPLRRLVLTPSIRNLSSIRRHAASARGEYFATCHPGLEEIVANELRSPAIGAEEVNVGKAGVSFSGDVGVLYRSNLWLRAAIRVLSLLREVELDPDLPAGDSIYDAFREAADWPALIKRGQCFSVDARIYGNSTFTNSQLLSIRARDAICDTIRDRTGSKPPPPERGRTPDLPLFVTSFQNQLRIYRDASGQSLHRRGYREAMHAASLNEAAAAGCLYLSGWAEQAQQEGAVLVDPMCGSGTFLIEAALMATNVAPGLYRRWWPFLTWPDMDGASWKDAVDEAKEARHPAPKDLILFGNDRHAGALSLASRDVRAAQVENLVKLHHGDCRTWELPQKPSLVVCNPPWGMRLMGAANRREKESARGESNDYERGGRRDYGSRGSGSGRGGGRQSWQDRGDSRGYNDSRRGYNEAEDEVDSELAGAWDGLGAFLKRQAGGADAFILSGSTKATQHLKLRADRRIPVTIGGVDCRLLQYHIRGLQEKKVEEDAIEAWP